ncbi:protein Wnt-10b-like [Euwallacea similis]|uniref:protein Wnt-10b-like n=1 Tax=Euwallacea similis TaxID=1736056 RepID=UPI00344BDF65
MGLRKIQTHVVVLIIILAVRLTSQRISPQGTQSKNEVDIYTSPQMDTDFCRTIPGLTKFQIELCRQQPDTIVVALEGLNHAVKECQNQFDGYRWNCSALRTRGKNPYISAILQQGYKETAFSYALASAGVVIAVARACSSASLRNCGCDEKIYKMKKPRQIHKENIIYNSKTKLRPLSSEVAKGNGIYTNSNPFLYYSEERKISPSSANNILNDMVDSANKEAPTFWKWGGCSHNLKYGLRFSKMFLDSREKADDIHSKTNLHNNQVGRMMVKHNMDVRCKCHGVSGSCQLKTCWRATPDLKSVGRLLMEKYSSAILIDPNQNPSLDLNLGRKNSRKFNTVNSNSPYRKVTIQPQAKRKKSKGNKRKKDLTFDLLYYERSPNFCDNITSLDIPGTTGRACNSTIKMGPNSCTSLCCGRGYNSVKRTKLERCHCEFVWCCEVKCDICSETKWINVCK